MQIPANCAGLSRVKVYYRLSSPITLPKILRGARGAAPLAVGDAERGAILGLSACRVRGSASIVQRHRDAETDDRINLGTVAGEDLTEKIPDTHLQPAKRDHIAQVDREPARPDHERQPVRPRHCGLREGNTQTQRPCCINHRTSAEYPYP